MFQFAPDLVIVSAGFDMALGDPKVSRYDTSSCPGSLLFISTYRRQIDLTTVARDPNPFHLDSVCISFRSRTAFPDCTDKHFESTQVDVVNYYRHIALICMLCLCLAACETG